MLFTRWRVNGRGAHARPPLTSAPTKKSLRVANVHAVASSDAEFPCDTNELPSTTRPRRGERREELLAEARPGRAVAPSPARARGPGLRHHRGTDRPYRRGRRAEALPAGCLPLDVRLLCRGAGPVRRRGQEADPGG